jgi:NRPS condensation-like uncharacterized protein
MVEYERMVSPLESVLMRSPYAIIAVVARIKGNVSENILKDAVKKAQKRHLNLRMRIQEHDHIPYFTSEGIKDIPIYATARESDDHWIKIYHEQCTVPFEFEARPAIRFILVHSRQTSELILLCHHILGDGMSLAYLARDIMRHLEGPAREVEVLPDPAPIGKDNFPKEVSINPIVRYFIDRINQKWRKKPIYFDREDYLSLNQAYWMSFKHHMALVELSEDQTTALVERCRKERVTVNTAITCAFVGAQSIILGRISSPNIMIAGSLRDRLQRPAGEAIGNYAAGLELDYEYDQKMTFWENSLKLHKKLKPLYANRHLFKELLTWCYLEPAILESLCFKMIGALVPPDSPRYDKLSSFSKQDDVISSLLRKQNMGSLEKPFLGTAVTNLTRLDFPRTYGSLELDRLIMNPGGMFPLAMVNLVIGAVTCAGKLSLLLEYEEKTIDPVTVEKIKEKALGFLLDGWGRNHVL